MTNTEAYPDKFTSLKEFHRALPQLLERHGTDKLVTLAALANPILALEHLGYSFTPELRHRIERRIRFDEKAAKKLTHLEGAMAKVADRPVPCDSPYDLGELIETLLTERTKGQSQNAKRISEADIAAVVRIVRQPLPLQLPGSERTQDPLEAYMGLHPILPILLEYREIEASAPRLASPDVFERTLNREQQLPFELTDIRFRYSPKANKERNE